MLHLFDFKFVRFLQLAHLLSEFLVVLALYRDCIWNNWNLTGLARWHHTRGFRATLIGKKAKADSRFRLASSWYAFWSQFPNGRHFLGGLSLRFTRLLVRVQQTHAIWIVIFYGLFSNYIKTRLPGSSIFKKEIFSKRATGDLLIVPIFLFLEVALSRLDSRCTNFAFRSIFLLLLHFIYCFHFC